MSLPKKILLAPAIAVVPMLAVSWLGQRAVAQPQQHLEAIASTIVALRMGEPDVGR